MASKRRLCCIVLCAGKGTRMKSESPKVLFNVCGRPLVAYVLDAVSSLSPERIVCVVGHKGDQVKDAITAWTKDSGWKGEVLFTWQKERKGTGHAVLSARDSVLGFDGDAAVLNGDATPLLTGRMLWEFYHDYLTERPAVSLVTSCMDDAASYGRVVREENGDVAAIVEASDAVGHQKSIREVNAGIYLAPCATLFELLDEVNDDNPKREYYFTDVVGIALSKGLPVRGFCIPDSISIWGVNDRFELSQVEELKRREMLRDFALAGVTIRDPASTYIDHGCCIGSDTVIEPHSYLLGRTSIGAGCVIGPGAHISNSTVRDGCSVFFSMIEESFIDSGVTIGPFSHIRPKTTLSSGVLVGNFAEVKNSVVGAGTKIHHHSYIGDTDMGERVNIGAGTVTVNYDGHLKHRTVIEDAAFIGCNANLIAPVKVGRGAYVAAGSTIDEEVPEGSLAIARSRQTNKEGWVARRKAKGR